MEIIINGHPQNMKVLGYACIAFLVVVLLAIIYDIYCWFKNR